MQDNSILEPLEEYNLRYKAEIVDNAKKYYKAMKDDSGIDEQKNAETVALYRKELVKIKHLNKTLRNKNLSKALLILLIICLFVVALCFGIFLFLNISKYKGSGFHSSYVVYPLICVLGTALGIVFIVLINKKINPKIKHIQEVKQTHVEQSEKYLAECYSQMEPLNRLFDYGMAGKVVTQTTPLIQIDDNFDIAKFTYMHEKYGLEEIDDINTSVYFCLSGSIIGNPFIYLRTFNKEMITKTYVGTRTVSWTEHNSKGETYTRTETLTAYYTAPAPKYFYRTKLIYGNEAAPNLNFSRQQSGANDIDKTEKALEKFIKKKEKKLNDYEEDALKEGNTSFVKLTNTEFDALFGAFNRDNEVEFRLLFTPLAQNNMVDLITKAEPYGDDFSFLKMKCLNYIISDHMQNSDIYDMPDKYVDYCLKDSEDRFIKYCSEYFQNLFFDLMPILSIPLYQQYKSKEEIYGEGYNYKSNFPSYEWETMANSFNINQFRTQDSTTNVILKSSFVRKDNKSDNINIIGRSFRGVTRIIDIPVRCSNGNVYDVPVEWIEYIPTKKITPMEVVECKSTRNNFNSNINSNAQFENLLSKIGSLDYNFQRGLLGMVLPHSKSFSEKEDSELSGLFGTQNCSPKKEE